MQRLFSTFADGWPGIGLLLLRLVTAAALIHFGMVGIREQPSQLALALQLTGMAGAILLMVGVLTPLAGTLTAIAKVCIAMTRFFGAAPGDPWIALAQATLAAALAMIGPGAWSVDARLFGRKHIDLPLR